jgi:hypothetical protein
MLNSEHGEIELSTDRQKADKPTTSTVKLLNGRVRLAPVSHPGAASPVL